MTTLGLDAVHPPALSGQQRSGATPLERAARPGVAADWTCDNCATPNAARRRCRDCGTLRY